jgi:hypothetical protein
MLFTPETVDKFEDLYFLIGHALQAFQMLTSVGSIILSSPVRTTSKVTFECL